MKNYQLATLSQLNVDEHLVVLLLIRWLQGKTLFYIFSLILYLHLLISKSFLKTQ